MPCPTEKSMMEMASCISHESPLHPDINKDFEANLGFGVRFFSFTMLSSSLLLIRKLYDYMRFSKFVPKTSLSPWLVDKLAPPLEFFMRLDPPNLNFPVLQNYLYFYLKPKKRMVSWFQKHIEATSVSVNQSYLHRVPHVRSMRAECMWVWRSVSVFFGCGEWFPSFSSKS